MSFNHRKAEFVDIVQRKLSCTPALISVSSKLGGQHRSQRDEEATMKGHQRGIHNKVVAQSPNESRGAASSSLHYYDKKQWGVTRGPDYGKIQMAGKCYEIAYI